MFSILVLLGICFGIGVLCFIFDEGDLITGIKGFFTSSLLCGVAVALVALFEASNMSDILNKDANISVLSSEICSVEEIEVIDDDYFLILSNNEKVEAPCTFEVGQKVTLNEVKITNYWILSSLKEATYYTITI